MPKNTQSSPDVFRVDLHFSQELPAPGINRIFPRARFRLFADIENVLNLIDSDWGALRQVSFPLHLVNRRRAVPHHANRKWRRRRVPVS